MINHWSQIQNNPIFSQPTELKWNLQYPTWTIQLLYCTCLGTSHRYELRWFRSELKDMRPSMFALWVRFCVCVLGPWPVQGRTGWHCCCAMLHPAGQAELSQQTKVGLMSFNDSLNRLQSQRDPYVAATFHVECFSSLLSPFQIRIKTWALPYLVSLWCISIHGEEIPSAVPLLIELSRVHPGNLPTTSKAW
jgi:hypothetical protein